jgi:hypothetical protein
VLWDPKDSRVYLVMELVERGELIGDVIECKPFDANITYIVDEVVKTLGHSQQMQVDNEPLI